MLLHLAAFGSGGISEIFYDDRQIDDADVIAEYGVKLIDCKYDKPIENTYK